MILEVDLECPQELHDLHNDYLCAAGKLNVSDDMLSAYCSNIKNLHHLSTGKVKKLIPTLKNKKKVILTLQILTTLP